MRDKWVEFAVRIQSIAQTGLEYGKDVYDLDRYNSAKMSPTSISGGYLMEKTGGGQKISPASLKR